MFLVFLFSSFLFPLSASIFLFFFFSSRRRHTRWPPDWSSDVCSSDLMGDVSAYLNKEQKELADTALTPEALGKMITLIDDGTLSSKMAKKVFAELIEKGGDPEKIIKEQGLVQISDEGQLTELVTKILDANEQSVEDFKNGKDRALGFLVGQVMKETRGQANPPMVNKILLAEMKKR